MEPVRAPFFVGLIGFGIGAVLLALWWFMSNPSATWLKFAQGLFFGLGLLLAITGGFLALCIGMVYVVYFFTHPRTTAKEAK
jgi:hypothetical protein